ncbi:MAG: 3-oxoadipate enol-lactonase [Mangrovicoccus sp.]
MPQFLQIDGLNLHVSYRPGTGRAVVFANSLGTDFRIWEDVIALLPEDLPILCIDKRGHGLSETGPVSIPRLAEDLAAAMEHFELRDALVCGVSIGGMIAQSLAATRPDLVSAVVFCCTGMKIGDETTWNPRINAVRDTGIEPIADAVMERWFSEGFRGDRPLDLKGYRTMLARTDAEGYARTCEAIRDCDLSGDAAKITQPSICIAGSVDLSTPPALVQALAEALPNSRYVEIEGVSHLPGIETPHAVAKAIGEL